VKYATLSTPRDADRGSSLLPVLRTPPPLRQRILITGASSGLGEQMARVWAAAGRDLALCARRTPELERLQDELLAAHPGIRVVTHALDVNDHEATGAVFGACAAQLGGLDRVVANAGRGRGGPIGTGAAADNRATAQTNFLGVLNQAESAVELFRRAGSGHFVIMSSMAALRGMKAHLNVYSASKAAVAALGEGLRSDLWRSPVTVTVIHPGWIRTPLATGIPNVILAVDTVKGTDAIVAAIEREPARAYVPARPWAFLALPMKTLPLGLFRRLGG
jgi:short-subunit dehydrogenase